MKLDKIKFARLIAMLASEYGYIHEDFIQAVDNLIDIEVPEQVAYPKNENVEALMKHMAAGTNKLDAIREHRAITGMGLKDSKEAVERYWLYKWTGEELFNRLTQSSYNADEEAAIKHFLRRL